MISKKDRCHLKRILNNDGILFNIETPVSVATYYVFGDMSVVSGQIERQSVINNSTCSCVLGVQCVVFGITISEVLEYSIAVRMKRDGE